jgi:hypothetical protein
VLGPDGARLAKRHGSATLADRGEPVPATLALLARSLGLRADRADRGGRADRADRVDRVEGAEVGSARDLIADFDPDRIPRQPVVLGVG